MKTHFAALGSALLALALASSPALAQTKQTKKGKAAAPAAAPHPLRRSRMRSTPSSSRNTCRIPRITTELVDHMPASDTVPSPLKFLGRIPGKPGELTYAHDIQRYYEALAKASPRARFWKIGHHRRGPRHRGAGHRRRGHHQGPRQVQRHARQTRRSAQDHRRTGQAARSTPPSPSTGSTAASIRPKPAARKCSSSWPTA